MLEGIVIVTLLFVSPDGVNAYVGQMDSLEECYARGYETELEISKDPEMEGIEFYFFCNKVNTETV